ncbi:MAG: N5-glutamine methyltransferase family protein [Minisyncoccota bacterium]
MTPDERWLLEEKYDGKTSAAFEDDRKRLAKGEPLAYVIGWQPFLGLKINLDSRPLIPRPETEWWMEQLFKNMKNSRGHSIEERTERDGASQSNFSATFFSYERSELENKKYSSDAEKYAVPKTDTPVRFITFLDLCAGSGAIGCAALARLPNAHVSFGEIDPTHEATILKNIRENGLDEARADVRIGDLFAPFDTIKFDIIAANPPYIPSGRRLPASVAEYEPALSLFAGDDGLEIIRRIAAELSRHLAPGGEAWIECDETSADTTAELFKEYGFKALVRTDQYRTPRLVVVSWVYKL